jgi:adenylate cyclase class IV
MKNIEIEFRALLDKDSLGRLEDYLSKNAENLGRDDKDVHFFLPKDRLLKVVHNTSKNTAKIVLKMSRIGHGSAFEEYEISIAPQDVEKTVEIFKNLWIPEGFHSFQKRSNYLYKGVEIACKYSDVWGYHAELEIVISDVSLQTETELKIKQVARELGVILMTEEELRAFVLRAEKESYKRGLE